MKDPRRVKAGRKSRRKGSGNERALAKLFESWWGGQWARTPQSGGWSSKDVREGFRTCGDLITTSEDFPFCVEAKAEEGWHIEQLFTAPKSAIYRFWDQAVEETPDSLNPLLVFKRNHVEHLVMTYEGVFCRVTLDFPHFLVRGTNLGDSLVIMRLSDLFKYDPSEFKNEQSKAAAQIGT